MAGSLVRRSLFPGSAGAARIRGAATIARRDWRLLEWSTTRKADVAYLGWVGRGNVGDELMFSAHRKLFGEHRMLAAPIHGPGRWFGDRVNMRADMLLLGGGTVIGPDAWAVRTEELLARDVGPLVIFGAGAVDPRFTSESGPASSDGWSRWAEMISSANYVGVRGPLSARTVEEVSGVKPVVVGDPALCVPVTQGTHLSRAGSVAINLTQVTDGLDGMDQCRTNVARCARLWASDGREILPFAMEKSDAAALKKYLSAAQVPFEKVFCGRADVLRALDMAELVVSERLHGAVLAANMGVPFIHLGYKPKSYDFAASIGAEQYVVTPSGASIEDMLSKAVDALQESFLNVTIRQQLRNLRVRFLTEHERVMDSLLGP